MGKAYLEHPFLYQTTGYPENDIPDSVINFASDIVAGKSSKVDPNRDLFREAQYHIRAFYFKGVKKMMEADQAERARLSRDQSYIVPVVSRAQLGPRRTDVREYDDGHLQVMPNAEWREFLGDELYVQMKEEERQRAQSNRRAAERRAREATPHPGAPVATRVTASAQPGGTVATGATVAGRASHMFRQAIGMRAVNPRSPSRSIIQATVDLCEESSDTDDTPRNSTGRGVVDLTEESE